MESATRQSGLADAAVSLLSELVSIDSVNPTLVDGAAGEAAIAAHLRARLDRAGFATAIVDAGDEVTRPSLVAVGRDRTRRLASYSTVTWTPSAWPVWRSRSPRASTAIGSTRAAPPT
ncbi:hypothetical protein [Flexivirga caeni]|uniref:Acetylornithine deacetylase n=1 Tax=Flexivirga caeni TaxID=2294115 RepID=A0A3M9LYF4_9MICO|nr:hypothetical protein [Flexivirga caeni]RNI17965.1 hypothetical protein EFY87_18870 [Flexivirga caeni]